MARDKAKSMPGVPAAPVVARAGQLVPRNFVVILESRADICIEGRMRPTNSMLLSINVSPQLNATSPVHIRHNRYSAES
jgi:hypothetical protein